MFHANNLVVTIAGAVRGARDAKVLQADPVTVEAFGEESCVLCPGGPEPYGGEDGVRRAVFLGAPGQRAGQHLGPGVHVIGEVQLKVLRARVEAERGIEAKWEQKNIMDVSLLTRFAGQLGWHLFVRVGGGAWT